MPPTPSPVTRGSCLCGGVRYEITGPVRAVTVCHCSQCRKTSGHVVAATQVLVADLQLLEAGTLAWYQSSDTAERGFCGRCGGNLFWRQTGATVEVMSVMAGTLDVPTGLSIDRHIFVADKSDYYDILDGLPQSSTWL
jgi:hypothetical protein